MRGRYWSLVMVGIALWPTTGQPAAAAASFALSEHDRLDAIRTGQKSVVHEEFGAEWRARDAAGQGLTVVTPYHRLALAARNAAFKKEPLRPRDVEALLKDAEGKLAFWVTLRGARSDFARFMTPTLEAGAEIKASFVQNERTALREDDGRFAARCLYVFPAEGVDPRGRVTLVVRDADERERAKFTVDLSGMR